MQAPKKPCSLSYLPTSAPYTSAGICIFVSATVSGSRCKKPARRGERLREPPRPMDVLSAPYSARTSACRCRRRHLSSSSGQTRRLAGSFFGAPWFVHDWLIRHWHHFWVPRALQLRCNIASLLHQRINQYSNPFRATTRRPSARS